MDSPSSEILSAFLNVVLTRGGTSTLDGLFSAQSRMDPHLMSAMRAQVQSFVDCLEEPRFTLLHKVQDDLGIAAVYRVEATLVNSGRTVITTVHIQLVIEDGHVLESFVHLDHLSLTSWDTFRSEGALRHLN